jgi:hypothetical protein
LYDVVHVVDEDGTANLMTMRGMVLPKEVLNIANILGIECNETDHLGWKDINTIESIVKQCPALGIKVVTVHIGSLRKDLDDLGDLSDDSIRLNNLEVLLQRYLQGD